MTDSHRPLTAQSTIGAWLEHPVGAPLLRGVLEQTGADEATLAPVRSLPLQRLVALSQGKLSQSVVDDMVMRANGGRVPEEGTDSGQ